MGKISLANGGAIELPGLTYAQLRSIFVSNSPPPTGVTETTGWVEIAANLTYENKIITIRKSNVVTLET